MEFTREQDQAIKDRGQDIFVSAGAGAGKTRVLVSRIADLITDPEDPVFADQILVMTFTNAAAQEMKDRITKELTGRLKKDPDNQHLRRQIRLIRQADISTVHSFCSRLLRRHFQEAEIDPSFRIGEEGEMTLLRRQAMEDLLEESYLSGSRDFLALVEAFAPGKDDWVLEDLIENLYHFSRGFPDAAGWFDRQLKEMEGLSRLEGFEESEPVMRLLAEADLMVADLKESCIWIRDLVTGGSDSETPELSDIGPVPERYEQVLAEDEEAVRKVSSLTNYREYHDALAGLRLNSLPRGVRKEEKDYPYLEEIKDHHHYVKDTLTDLADSSFLYSPEELCRENEGILPYLKEFARLVLRYEEIYGQRKKEQNVYDFDDLEHMTLKLLVSSYDEEGQPVPSETARALSRKYREIFVDEYQDTSLIQETILKVLHHEGLNHLFVVGDIKQSIYRFRQARPDLFLARQRSSEGTHISLADNFRSAPDVLKLCNQLFSGLMEADFGGVDYREGHALRTGKGSPMEELSERSEILLLMEDEEKDQLPVEYDALYAESAMIAKRAGELVEEGWQYSDMVILLRSGGSRAEAMAEYLARMEIPARCETRMGYFQTREVGVILNYLSVIDNVYQDIPMASVLLSSIGGLTEEDLVSLKIQVEIPMRQDHSLYDLLHLYARTGEDEELKERIIRFLMQLSIFRRQKKELPLHQLLWNIYMETGFYYDVLLMTDGDKRRENLNMLLQKAEDYEKTVFKGLFYFIRYIRQLQTYEVDLSEAGSGHDPEDAIRIMTIHKSKGLEFPVVFVSGLSGQFNFSDTNRSLLYHPRLGMGVEVFDMTHRIHHPSLMKNMLKDQIHTEALEEELRILYVAMTRAQEKLILTGVVTEKAIDRHRDNPLDLFSKKKARCFMDWILPAIYSEADPDEEDERDLEDYVRKIHLHQLDFPQAQGSGSPEEDLLLSLSEAAAPREELGPVEKAFAYRYPYEHLTAFKRKYSVSELKKLSMAAPPEETGTLDMEYDPGTEEIIGGRQGAAVQPVSDEKDIPVPDFLKEEKTVSATDRGTIFHKIMELLPFGKIESKEDLYEALYRIREEYSRADLVSMKQVARGAEQFLFSKEGDEIRRMDREGRFFKEVPFTISIPESMVMDTPGKREYPGDPDQRIQEDNIIVQGIIDAYGETEEGLWLIDYKTDHIEEGEEDRLLDRYQKQMLYYKTALLMLVKKPVVKTYIYSFALGKFLDEKAL